MTRRLFSDQRTVDPIYLFKVVGFDDLTCKHAHADAHISSSFLFRLLSTFRYQASVDSRHLKVIFANYVGNLNSIDSVVPFELYLYHLNVGLVKSLSTV